ncbi:MAG: dCTP deaminase [Capsulimonadaceae bacterium]
MILSDNEIRAALRFGQISLEPMPSRKAFSTTAVDLTLSGVPLRQYRTAGQGVNVIFDPAIMASPTALAPYLNEVPFENSQERSSIITPGEFFLGLTTERIELPQESRLAARVEGRSLLARMGLLVHISAPIIHCGFRGQITLEIKNLGEYPIRLRPGLRICQLVVETVFGTPSEVMQSVFQDQTSVVGQG